VPQQTPRAVIAEPPSDPIEAVITMVVAVRKAVDEAPVITGTVGTGGSTGAGDDLLQAATNKIDIKAKYAGMDFIKAFLRVNNFIRPA
jgi:hypothetical protein